jgi:hypothetical protein
MSKRLLLPTTLLMAVAALPAHAADWRAVVHQCDQYAESTFCQGKAGCPNWQWLAACTVQNMGAMTSETQARFKRCVAAIEQAREQQHACFACGDPVGDVLRCMG